MNRICFGCGANLQSADLTKKGYILKEKYDNSPYCQRCYKLIHYGTKYDDNFAKSLKNIIEIINKEKKFVIYLIDFLNLNSKSIEIYHQIKSKKMLIISKCDLIPKNIKILKLKQYLRNFYLIKEDLKLVSAFNNFGINSLNEYLDQIKECYLVGATNSGKSSLINALIDINKTSLNKTTISKYQNTTLDFLKIPLSENKLIIDSPGFSLNNYQIDNHDNAKIKPRTYQMECLETLAIGNIYLNFNKQTSVILYLPNNLKVKKHYQKVEFSNSIDISNNEDLVISGLGFINIKQKNKILTSGLDLELIETRKSILGDYRE